MRTEADLIDQIFNSDEKRLASILLSMAEFGERFKSERLIPEISVANLAKMIGIQRSRVSFFMTRFREFALIDYDGRIRVHQALFNAILHDQLSGDNAAKPTIVGIPPGRTKPAKLATLKHPMRPPANAGLSPAIATCPLTSKPR